MNQKDIKLTGNYIQKRYRMYLLILGLIAAFELALTVRGLLLFDLTRLKHRLYFYSYLFLMVVSVITFVVLLLCKNKKEHIRHMAKQAYAYSTCLILWAAFVSMIDCMASGDSGVMVYIMVCISVGGFTLINPVFYSIILCTSGMGMLVAVGLLRGLPYSFGFYTNFAVFLLIAILLNAHNYKLNQKEYAASAKLKQLSYTDQLTGLHNRRQLDVQIAKCAEHGESYLFVLIDVDDFKSVNDTYGHAVGDKCLILIAKILSEFFGKQVFRYGGDEFAIICDLEAEEAVQRIQKVNHELGRSYDRFSLHISAGAYHAQKDDPAEQVFVRADKALYQAKADGKNTCKIFVDG